MTASGEAEASREDQSTQVVFFSDAPVRGGAEQNLGTVLEHLDPRFRVTVVGVVPEVVSWIAERRPGTSTELVPAVRNKGDVRNILRQLAVIRRLRPDILHVNLATPWQSQFTQLAGVVTSGVRTVAVENSPVASSDRLQIVAKRWLSRKLDAHVAVGAWLGQEIERLVGLRPGAVEVVHNGIPRAGHSPDELVEMPPGLVVGSVGRLHPEKGFDVLIRAMAGVDASLVLVGQGPDQPRLEALVSELGLDEQVRFTGWVVDARAWLVRYDIFVLPSFLEGFPLSTLEAMLAGIPVVASDVGGVSEAVRDGDTGLLVPPHDVEALRSAITSLVANPDKRSEMGRRGRALVEERFTARAMAQRYEALYDRLLR